MKSRITKQEKGGRFSCISFCFRKIQALGQDNTCVHVPPHAGGSGPPSIILPFFVFVFKLK